MKNQRPIRLPVRRPPVEFGTSIRVMNEKRLGPGGLQ